MSLNIIFAGTPDFAVPTLKKLIESEHSVVAVYTQPDRPAGRGQQVQSSPVKQLAIAHNIPVLQPKTLRDPLALSEFRTITADVMVVVAYGLILPLSVISIPRLGCVNLHPSLLPRWRGAAPIPRALQAGDRETGITIMQMDQGMDTGPILRQEKIILVGNETTQLLHDQFSQHGAALMLKTIRDLEKNTSTLIAQNDALATYASKIDKKEALIDWKKSVDTISNLIRAFNAWPVAHTLFLEEPLKIWEAKPLHATSKLAPGTLVQCDKEGLCVATGDGVLKILSVQLPGKKRISATDFVNAHAANLIAGKTKLG